MGLGGPRSRGRNRKKKEAIKYKTEGD